MSESEPDKDNSNLPNLSPEISKQNGENIIEVGEIAGYIAEMLDPLSELAGETGMELLSLLIDFAAREAHNIKDNNSTTYDE